MKGDPNKRNKNKYCHFHKDHGHDTDECFDLKQQIENLIRQGKLRHFVGRDHKDEKLKAKMEESSQPPLGEIKVIIEGTSVGQTSKSKKTYLKVVQNVQLSGRSPKMRGIDESTICFTDEEAERIHHPQRRAASSLPYLLQITQLEGCWWIMGAQQIYCTIQPSSR